LQSKDVQLKKHREQEEGFFHQQIGYKFEEESNKMLGM
jgi:hypothetical protein